MGKVVDIKKTEENPSIDTQQFIHEFMTEANKAILNYTEHHGTPIDIQKSGDIDMHIQIGDLKYSWICRPKLEES